MGHQDSCVGEEFGVACLGFEHMPWTGEWTFSFGEDFALRLSVQLWEGCDGAVREGDALASQPWPSGVTGHNQVAFTSLVAFGRGMLFIFKGEQNFS